MYQFQNLENSSLLEISLCLNMAFLIMLYRSN